MCVCLFTGEDGSLSYRVPALLSPPPIPHPYPYLLVTARKRSWGKVIFSQVSVCPQRRRGLGLCTGSLYSGGVPVRVSLSGGISVGGSLSRRVFVQGSLGQGDPPYGKERAVRIPLECILVILCVCLSTRQLWLLLQCQSNLANLICLPNEELDQLHIVLGEGGAPVPAAE